MHLHPTFESDLRPGNHSEQPGLFRDLRLDDDIRCSYIPECKHYINDLDNHATDQLGGQSN
jgi:hypothetical protein